MAMSRRRRVAIMVFAAADAVAAQDLLAAGDGGEVVQPAGHAGGQQRAPHPGRVNCGGRHIAGAGAAAPCLPSRKTFSTPVPVPVLCGGGLVRRGHVQVRQDEAAAVDGAGAGELEDRQGALAGVQGVRRHRERGSAETCSSASRTRRTSSEVFAGHQSGR